MTTDQQPVKPLPHHFLRPIEYSHLALIKVYAVDVNTSFCYNRTMNFLVHRRLSRVAILLAVTALPLAASARSEPAKHCVWRIKNAKAPFYLVGSIHALSARDYPLAPPFQQALSDSHRLLFEYDPKRSAEFATKLTAAAKYPKGQDVRNKIHRQTLAYLRQYTQTVEVHYDKNKKQHIDVGTFDRALVMRPWALSLMMGVPGYSDVSSHQGVDAYLGTQAHKLGKETGGLETPEEHVGVLSGLTDLDGEILLLDCLVYARKSRSDYDHIRAAWKRGDTDAITKSDARLRKEAWWIAQRLVEERNVRWLPRIEREIKSGTPTAVVAGALHYSGPNSVIALLRKRGYEIEQL